MGGSSNSKGVVIFYLLTQITAFTNFQLERGGGGGGDEVSTKKNYQLLELFQLLCLVNSPRLTNLYHYSFLAQSIDC